MTRNPAFEPGSEVAPRVLLLHGFFAGRAAWDRVRRELGRHGVETFAPDLLGYGEHRHGHGPGDYSLSRTIEHLIPAVERVQPTHIVGHSMGGMVALGLERSLPGQFKALGIVGLPVFSNARDGKSHQALRGRKYQIYMRTHGFSHYGCTIVHRLQVGWLPFAHYIAPRQPSSVLRSVFNHSRDAHLVGLTGIAFGGHVPTLAQGVETPVFMLHGMRDLTAPLDRAHRVAEQFGWDFETTERANHQVIVERPLVVADWIRRKVLGATTC